MRWGYKAWVAASPADFVFLINFYQGQHVGMSFEYKTEFD